MPKTKVLPLTREEVNAPAVPCPYCGIHGLHWAIYHADKEERHYVLATDKDRIHECIEYLVSFNRVEYPCAHCGRSTRKVSRSSDGGPYRDILCIDCANEPKKEKYALAQ